MTVDEFEHKLDMLGALEAFRSNLWHEWEQTVTEHVAHMNRIGVDDMYGYVFMGLHWNGAPEGFEYWHAVANAFGRKDRKTLTSTDGNNLGEIGQGVSNSGQI